jgi:deazaflavin-dependent oxidoreductase (nitroreductase family)
MATTAQQAEGKATLPPRWVVRLAWLTHRSILRVTRGRRGLAMARPDHEGYLRLRTIGRRSGRERSAILCYVEDGGIFVTLAMNGWAAAEPAWWLNLRGTPDAIVDLKTGSSRPVHARAAEGEERARLWNLLGQFRGWGADLDAYERRRGHETTVVVFEPRS